DYYCATWDNSLRCVLF
nr:immunoglobulin light chain junction region [Macaca mulatta]